MPAMPRPASPAQAAIARPSPTQPAQLSNAPYVTKRTVAMICQTMFWNASSPVIQPAMKLTRVKGSRLIG